MNKPIFHIALLILLTTLAYSNTFNVPFVFDDGLNIVENYIIKDISNIPRFFVGAGGGFASRPLMHATFALNYHFGGLDTTGYHVVNLSIHLLNGVLLYFLVIMAGRVKRYPEGDTRAVALLSALFFALHPVHTDAVTYVVSRSVLLATMFYLLGLMIFHKAVTADRGRGFYIAGLFVVSLLGMASREDFVTFPAMLFLYDLFFISEFKPRGLLKNFKAYLPVLASLGYMAWLVKGHTYDKGTFFPEYGISPLDYALTQLKVHWTYLRLLFLPVNQNIDHNYPIVRTLLNIPALLAFLGYAGLWALGFLFAKKRPITAFGALWFLVILLPVSFAVAFMDLRLGHVMFEHRLYLPSIGPTVAFAAGMIVLLKAVRGRTVKAAALLVVVAIPLALSCAAYARNAKWSSELSLWEDSVRKSPNNATAHGNLGIKYYKMGRYDLAIKHFKEGLRLEPGDSKGYNNLGLSYEAVGQTDVAIELYTAALAQDPVNIKARNNLGRAYLSKGLTEKALELLMTSVRVQPDSPEAHFHLGQAYLKIGNVREARKEFESALRINPDYEAVRKALRDLPADGVR